VEHLPLNQAEDEITLGRVLQFWRRWWLTVLGSTVLLGSLVAAVVFSLPRYYASHFSVYVTGLNNMAASAQVQMQLAALFGLSSGGTEYVTAVIESDLIQLQVIDQLKLTTDKDFWWGDFLGEERTPEKTLEQLRNMSKVEGPQAPLQGPVSLTIKTISAELSYKIANEILYLLNVKMQEETKNRSSFLEDQLKNSQSELDKAERALKDFAESEGISVALEEQSKEEFLAQVELKTQKILAEVELKALRSRLGAPGDVKVQMILQSEIAGLEAKVSELESVMSSREGNLKQLPRQTKRYVDLMRDVKSREKIFEVYLEHYELARLYEVGRSETRPYRVIDTPYQAVRPVKRYGLLKTLAGLMVGTMVGLAWALFRESLALARAEASRLGPLPSESPKKAPQDKESQL
jgi:uncharacterized protein involved in exopolysaccharide biosynthesis